MHKFWQVTPSYTRRHTAGRAVVVLILATVALACLLVPAIHAGNAAGTGRLSSGAQAAGLTKSLLVTSVAALSATEAMLVGFALALAAGALLLGTAELLWRFSRRPDSRS